jgi:hypothetical protein
MKTERITWLPQLDPSAYIMEGGGVRRGTDRGENDDEDHAEFVANNPSAKRFGVICFKW